MGPVSSDSRDIRGKPNGKFDGICVQHEFKTKNFSSKVKIHDKAINLLRLGDEFSFSKIIYLKFELIKKSYMCSEQFCLDVFA